MNDRPHEAAPPGRLSTGDKSDGCRRSRRLRTGSALALIAAAIAGTVLLVHWKCGREADEPRLGRPYVVRVGRRGATFDVDFSCGDRYLVVIGSAAHFSGRFEIACSSQRLDGAHHIPRQFAPRVARRLSTCREFEADPVRESQAVGRHAAENQAAENHVVENHVVENRATKKQNGNQAAGPTDMRTFALHVTEGSLDDAAQYATVRARRVAEGRQVRIYLDERQAPRELPPGLVANVVDLLDADVMPRMGSFLGTHRDVDRDGRFAVLLTPWLGHLQGGRTTVGGFVRGSDFLRGLGAPFSNRCDMMYVNSATLPGQALRTLLIHEYAHAVCFSRRTFDDPRRPGLPPEEDWLNEAIAHCAEDLLGAGWTNRDYRVARFLNEPAAFPLVVRDYYGAGLWRCHGCRGATYLFLRHCVNQFGPQVLSRLVGSPLHGKRNLESVTGLPFRRLFRDWTLGLACCDVEGPSVKPRRAGAAGAAPVGAALAGAPRSAPRAFRRANSEQQKAIAVEPIDLCGRIGDWGLAGPARLRWDVDEASGQQISLQGMTAAYLEVEASRSRTARRIRVSAPPHAGLQVSLIRIPSDWPRIDVSATWADLTLASTTGGKPASSRGAAPGSPAAKKLRITVRLSGAADLTVTQISAEQNAGETRVSTCLSGKELGLAALTAGGRGSPAAADVRIFEVPADRLASADVPLIVKVVARDGSGRRATARTRLASRGEGAAAGARLARQGP